MTPEELRQRASNLFDDPNQDHDLHGSELSDDREAWISIANHLQSAQVVALPADFADQVQRAIKRARFWSDVLLIFKVCSVTGLALTLVVASALGLSWWHRLSVAVQSIHPGSLTQTLMAKAGAALATLAPLFRVSERVVPLIPVLLITVAVFAVLAELAVFRLLRLGPFRTHNLTDLN